MPLSKSLWRIPGMWWACQIVNDRNWDINFYFITVKLNQWWIDKYCLCKCLWLSRNCLGYSMITRAYLGVRWPDCFSLVTRVATTVMSQKFVTLNSSHTLNQNRQKNIHYYSWEKDQDYFKWFDNKTIFENTNYLQGFNCLTVNTPIFCLIFVIIILIHVCFLKHFKSWV